MKKENITYEVIENLGVLSTSKSGWTTEVNLISWNGKPSVIDIRAWSPDREKMGKGITFTAEEKDMLKEILENVNMESVIIE